jgi:hypothetical protein
MRIREAFRYYFRPRERLAQWLNLDHLSPLPPSPQPHLTAVGAQASIGGTPFDRMGFFDEDF